MTATFTAKFLKEANYDSKLFKIVEVNKTHQLLDKFVKNWEDMEMIYLKNKYLKNNKLEPKNYYKFRVGFQEFVNNEGKDVVYINKIKYKPVEFTEKVFLNIEDEDSDF